jgi:catechol 2,3-dioxygenase-like lactoylglutathione lyase family enzyme
MLIDLTLGINDMPRSVRFYEAIFAALGVPRLPDDGDWAGWGKGREEGFSLWLCPPFNGQPATIANGSMLTFAATSAAQVRAFHAQALAHGGTDEGAPGIRARYSPDFYVAYVRDPDGHKLCAVFDTYDPAGDHE